MGVDYHAVCKCGSHYSEYTPYSGVRRCRGCGQALSINREFLEASPCYGMTEEQIDQYFETGIDPRKE